MKNEKTEARQETPYSRFEDLTRRLLSVSKRELDKQAKAYARKKRRKPRAGK